MYSRYSSCQNNSYYNSNTVDSLAIIKRNSHFVTTFVHVVGENDPPTAEVK